MRTITAESAVPKPRMANYFDPIPGAIWGPRIIEDPELVFVIRGRLYYDDMLGNALHVEKGDILFIEPAIEHTLYDVSAPAKSTISCVHMELCQSGTWAGGDYRTDPMPQSVTHIDDFGPMENLFKDITNVFKSHRRHRDKLISTIAHCIWLRLVDHWGPCPTPNTLSRLEQMKSYLREHMGVPVTRQDLSAEFGLTPQYINHLFRHELGTTPTEYLNRHRILIANELLAQGESVKSAAAKVGFVDQFYFSKLFKRILGVPPSKAW